MSNFNYMTFLNSTKALHFVFFFIKCTYIFHFLTLSVTLRLIYFFIDFFIYSYNIMNISFYLVNVNNFSISNSIRADFTLHISVGKAWCI